MDIPLLKWNFNWNNVPSPLKQLILLLKGNPSFNKLNKIFLVLRQIDIKYHSGLICVQIALQTSRL